MLPIDSKYSPGELNTLRSIPVPNFLSLNEVFRESLRKAQETRNLQVVVRCEPLPQVQVNAGELMPVIDDLLRMILSYPPTASKLFLYVDCEEDAADIIDMHVPEGLKRYNIKFFTNISTGAEWELANGQTLANCRQVLSRCQGSLAVNDVSSTGCLFSIVLPGKIV